MTTRVTVMESAPFAERVTKLLSVEEIRELTNMLSENPTCGVVIPGAGGVRKVRFAAKGHGKSGGVRVIYYFHNHSMPLYALNIYAKNEQTNLSQAQIKTLAQIAAAFAKKG
jgi:hypothetical protein